MKLTESRLKEFIRQEIKSQINQNAEAAEKTIQARKHLLNRVNPILNELIKHLEMTDPDMADWAKGVQNDMQELAEELFDLGNELSQR